VLLHFLQQCAGHAASIGKRGRHATVCCAIGRACSAF